MAREFSEEDFAPQAPAAASGRTFSDDDFLPAGQDGTAPEKAIDTSPLSFADRLRMSFGNDRGAIGFLKTKFEDAKKAGNELVVKQNGKWHKVDSSSLELSDLADMVGAVPGMVGGVVGGTAGVIGGGGVASIATGAAGAAAGAAAGEVAKQAVGRAFGTYEADAAESLEDVAMEGLIGGVFQVGAGAVSAAAKSVGIKEAFKRGWQNAGNFAKENFSSLYATMLKQPRESIRRAMDASDEVFKYRDAALKSLDAGTSPTAAVDKLAGRQASVVAELAEEIPEAMQRQYGRDATELARAAGADFVMKPKEALGSVLEYMEQKGYGRAVSGSNGEPMFRLAKPAEIAEMMGTNAEELPKIFGPNTLSVLQDITRTVQAYQKIPELRGTEGIKRTIQLRRALGEKFSTILDGDAPAGIKAIVADLKQQAFNAVGSSFKGEAATLYAGMNKRYAESADFANLLRQAVNARDPGAVDNVVKRLVSKAGANRSFKDEAADVAKILGEKGAAKLNSLVDMEAAKAFVDFVPKSLEGSSVGLVGRTLGLATQQANPRVVGKQIQYVKALNKFMGGLTPDQKLKFLKDDKAVAAVFQALAAGYEGEDQIQSDLLRQSGAQP